MSNGMFKIPFPENEKILDYAPGSAEKKQLRSELANQMTNVESIPIVIGDKTVMTGQTTDVVMPHDHNHCLAKAHTCSADDVGRAIENAVEAQKEWANMSFYDRAAVFLKAADLLATKYRPIINASTMLGQSKTVYQAEIDAACELIDFFKFNAYFAEKIYSDQPLHSPKGQWNMSEARGLEGFVFAIGPFNFTSISINLACAPALMGCSVLWKPSPTAMFASYLGLKMLQEAGLPPGVINMVHGDPQMIGNVALKHKDLAGIHFTGSTQTFQHLWQEVGKNIRGYKSYPRVVGETGGKDFVFAHPSADPEALVCALVRGAFEYQGQKCSAASRAYIPKSLWQIIKEPLCAKVASLKMGDPSDFSNFVAAVIDQRAFDKITGYIEDAKKSANAEVLVGGESDSDLGYFVKPTIIEAKEPSYKTMVEEIFGPVLTIYVYEDNQLDEALDNCEGASAYGLTGAIFAQDRRDIARLSNRLKYAAGNFYINDKPTGAVVGQQPFGGSRASGTNDKAGSMYNLIRWVSHRTIKENFIPPTDYRYPFMEES